ncbi:energy transducer TonB [Agarivorans gilvus]|uniref:Protein TonB n=1 Tax=Agarivorans gilvus TaxID=680279 RepID=A0ABQ1I6Z7_9ALTE|nr:energy transducer TonB [Agarivorans gilvus]GGB21430.1 protein TonB [Agarivorans gilvus]
MRKLSLAVLLSVAIHGYLLNAPSKAKEMTLTNGGQTAAPSLNVVAINTNVVSKTEPLSPKQTKPLAEKQPVANTVTPAQQPEATAAKSQSKNTQSKPVKPKAKPQTKPKIAAKQPPTNNSKALPIKEVKDEPQPNKSLSTTTKQTKPTPPQQVKETPPQPVKPAVDAKQQPEAEPLASSQVNSQPQHQQGLSQLPRLNSQPRFAQPPSAPVYPRVARKRGLEGTVMVEVWLDRHGRQTKREITDSSGIKSLDKAALKAVQQWKFKALIVDGQAQASRAVIPIRFKLS